MGARGADDRNNTGRKTTTTYACVDIPSLGSSVVVDYPAKALPAVLSGDTGAIIVAGTAGFSTNEQTKLCRDAACAQTERRTYVIERT